MEITVNNRKGNQITKIMADDTATLKEFKKLFYSKIKKYPPERQLFSIPDPAGKKDTPLKDDSKTLKSYGLQGGDILLFKDLGPQVSWRTVFLIEYLGPLLTFPLFYFFPQLFYSTPSDHWNPIQKYDKVDQNNNRIAFWLVIGHYVKREFESLFVHRFSNDTMPFNRIFINSSHYWILCGILIPYFLYHPKYNAPNYPPYLVYALVCWFVFSEIMNLCCHLVLRSLRPAGSKSRGIPGGFGFDKVSCANYFWEIMSWTAFSVLTCCLTCFICSYLIMLIAFLFLIVSTVQMTQWALKKHRRYHEEFTGEGGIEKYPKNRKAIFPWLL